VVVHGSYVIWILSPVSLVINAVAMSLYQYNVQPGIRVQKLYDHFNGDCAELDELLRLVDSTYWATEMAYPTAKVYLQHALERYGDEAKQRIRLNEQPYGN